MGQRFFTVSLQRLHETIEVRNSQGKILKSRTLPLRQDERIMLASWPSQRQGHYFSRDYRDIEFFSISEPNARTFYSADSKHNSPFEKTRELTGLGTVRFESRNVAYMLGVMSETRGDSVTRLLLPRDSGLSVIRKKPPTTYGQDPLTYQIWSRCLFPKAANM